jgi:hypothetical protein
VRWGCLGALAAPLLLLGFAVYRFQASRVNGILSWPTLAPFLVRPTDVSCHHWDYDTGELVFSYVTDARTPGTFWNEVEERLGSTLWLETGPLDRVRFFVRIHPRADVSSEHDGAMNQAEQVRLSHDPDSGLVVAAWLQLLSTEDFATWNEMWERDGAGLQSVIDIFDEARGAQVSRPIGPARAPDPRPGREQFLEIAEKMRHPPRPLSDPRSWALPTATGDRRLQLLQASVRSLVVEVTEGPSVLLELSCREDRSGRTENRRVEVPAQLPPRPDLPFPLARQRRALQMPEGWTIVEAHLISEPLDAPARGTFEHRSQ